MRHLPLALAVFILAAFAVSTAGEPPRHVIYLHGRIVQDQQAARPLHPEYGHYELESIIESFRDREFIVTSAIRPKGESLSTSADRTVAEVRRIIDSGIDADRITVVGASMGAAIGLRVAARLGNPEVRFVLLGPCLSANIPALARDENAHPMGHILGIRELSDTLTTDCSGTLPRHEEGLSVREIVLNTGLAHGFLYRPLKEWLDPATEWATTGDLAVPAVSRAGQR